MSIPNDEVCSNHGRLKMIGDVHTHGPIGIACLDTCDCVVSMSFSKNDIFEDSNNNWNFVLNSSEPYVLFYTFNQQDNTSEGTRGNLLSMNRSTCASEGDLIGINIARGNGGESLYGPAHEQQH